MRSLRRVVVAALVAGVTFGAVSLSGKPAHAAFWSCVPYARHVSDVNLQGDAWRWWDAANGVYAKGQRPREGAILVFRRTGGLNRGHVAVVRKVVDSRTIMIDHANWGRGRKGKIDNMVAVRDVSPNNDWTATRVWYTPIGDFGNTNYPTYGFIYDKSPRSGGMQNASYTPSEPVVRGVAPVAPVPVAAGPRATPLNVAARATGTYLPGAGGIVWSTGAAPRMVQPGDDLERLSVKPQDRRTTPVAATPAPGRKPSGQLASVGKPAAVAPASAKDLAAKAAQSKPAKADAKAAKADAGKGAPVPPGRKPQASGRGAAGNERTAL